MRYDPGVQTGITSCSVAGAALVGPRLIATSISNRCVCGRGMGTVNVISGAIVCAAATFVKRKNRRVNNGPLKSGPLCMPGMLLDFAKLLRLLPAQMSLHVR